MGFGLDDKLSDSIEGSEIFVEVLLVLSSDGRVGRPELDGILLDLEVEVAETHESAEGEANEQDELGIFDAELAQLAKPLLDEVLELLADASHLVEEVELAQAQTGLVGLSGRCPLRRFLLG